jgi:hypothetical protein
MAAGGVIVLGGLAALIAFALSGKKRDRDEEAPPRLPPAPPPRGPEPSPPPPGPRPGPTPGPAPEEISCVLTDDEVDDLLSQLDDLVDPVEINNIIGFLDDCGRSTVADEVQRLLALNDEAWDLIDTNPESPRILEISDELHAGGMGALADEIDRWIAEQIQAQIRRGLGGFKFF